ncbi:MAG TPA: cyclic dehypoxanthinyl futalosine synthase [Desulfomonilaceae bacterium]|nr:cyclic dehypoxanthinyl futalosine synthase [Desulfomonilaceae bacterium]
MNIRQAMYQAESGARLSIAAARLLHDGADLLTLGQLAQTARFRRNSQPIVTYAVDRNINYTNVCTSGCRFCAFWKAATHRDAYVMDDETLARKLQETKALGGTHILFQGGLNPDLNLNWHERRIRLIRSFGLKLHGYSPPEICFFAKQSGSTVEQVLERFVKAGLNSIPGGGAEILVDRVRRITSPGKATSREWLSVMAAAHKLGLRTTATMMFGHIESVSERLVHLVRIRRLQDQTGGFTSFIPWPYQPGRETLQVKAASANAYLRMLALSRLMLDNFPHVQASWVTQGADIGQIALSFGADDLGSTMIEENVVAAAGVSHRLTEADMIRLIEAAGFEARQRDAVYGMVGAAS